MYWQKYVATNVITSHIIFNIIVHTSIHKGLGYLNTVSLKKFELNLDYIQITLNLPFSSH